MQGISIAIVGSLILAFKAVLLEGSEVAILSLATIKQPGKRNVLFGVILGAIGSLVILSVIRQIFTIFPDVVIDTVTGLILLGFSAKFWYNFYELKTGKESFQTEMSKEAAEMVEKDMKRAPTAPAEGILPFSPLNALPVLTITLTEGFEASLVISGAGRLDVTWTIIGALISLALIIGVSAYSYEYLMRFPRWVLDVIAGIVLLSFGLLFLVTAAGIIH